MTKTAHNQDAIDDAYIVAQREALDLLAQLTAIVEDMPAPGSDDYAIHWGHVGDMRRVSTAISEVIGALEASPA